MAAAATTVTTTTGSMSSTAEFSSVDILFYVNSVYFFNYENAKLQIHWSYTIYLIHNMVQNIPLCLNSFFLSLLSQKIYFYILIYRNVCGSVYPAS